VLPELSGTQAVNAEAPGDGAGIRQPTPPPLTVVHGEIEGPKATEMELDRARSQAENSDEIGDLPRQFDGQQRADAEGDLAQADTSP
jgi:hypothetical protein